MCLIINRPEGIGVSERLLSRAIDDNPHGWGIMAHSPVKGMTIRRGMKAASFWKAWSKIGDAPCVIHFRWATHGAKGLDNCHPFDICDGKYAVMHNGIISTPLREPNRSDTYHFANDVIAPILRDKPSLFGTPYLADLFGRMVGVFNKLVVMRRDGKTMVVNEQEGTEYEGCWLSNENSIPFLPVSRGLNAWDQRDDYMTDSDRSMLRRYLAMGKESESDELNDPGGAPGSRGAATLASQYYSLSDLASEPWEDIVEFCLSDPELVANMITDEYWSK